MWVPATLCSAPSPGQCTTLPTPSTFSPLCSAQPCGQSTTFPNPCTWLPRRRRSGQARPVAPFDLSGLLRRVRRLADLSQREFAAAFFFSSRRRHTRWTGDWSSDVCSSDLDRGNRCNMRTVCGQEQCRLTAQKIAKECALEIYVKVRLRLLHGQECCHEQIRLRSEERRVGKEWRCRWTPFP